ncbi:dethiobiotin synthase [Vallitalea pronyensis]|uniref:ATP-dependent dethiobiotin synthetase BioD n=1 Tax=Vallitalea pronyensis TaxID=1348613 RepID=A0A8J8SI26_9FIRM|nr:dethiobiotin synthase [Vallitalea pronyensis]QUI24176.1 dethiobiotin synthase [Vallitalea pronyensis]
MISATGTDIGKTYVTAGLAYTLAKQGKKVAYYKPIQSGGEEQNKQLVAPDVEFVKSISHKDASIDCYNTYCFREPVSPHLAAEMEQVEMDIHHIIKTYDYLQEHYDVVMVEGAGGLAVPLIRGKIWLYDLIKRLFLDVVMVADAGVGTLNHTLQAYAFAKSKGLKVPLIVLNRYDENKPAHVDNKRIINEEIPAEVFTMGSSPLEEPNHLRKHYTHWLDNKDILAILTGEDCHE